MAEAPRRLRFDRLTPEEEAELVAGDHLIPRELGFLNHEEASDYWFNAIAREGKVLTWALRSHKEVARSADLAAYAAFYFRLHDRDNPWTRGLPQFSVEAAREILQGVLRRAKYQLRARNLREVTSMHYFCSSVEADGDATVVRLQAHTAEGNPVGRAVLRMTGTPEIGPFQPGAVYELSLRELGGVGTTSAPPDSAGPLQNRASPDGGEQAS